MKTAVELLDICFIYFILLLHALHNIACTFVLNLYFIIILLQ